MPETFSWLSGRDVLDDIYCVSFVRNVEPGEVLRRFGVDEETFEDVSLDELTERSAENAEDCAGFVGAAELDGWTLLIEPGGWKTAVDDEVRARISQGSEVVSVCRHDYASDSFAYEIDGETVLAFDPHVPAWSSGSDPERFAEAMREVGLLPDDTIENAIPKSFALASRITGVPFTQDMLKLRFLGAEPVED